MLDHVSVTVSDVGERWEVGGEPGIRGNHPSYYAAFLIDPQGNRIEAACHKPAR